MVNPFNPASVAQFKSMAVAATSLKLEIQKFEARRFDEAVDAVAAISKAKLDAVAFSNDPLFYSNAEALAVLMLRARLPSIGFREYAEAGGLLAYGVDRQALWKRAALVVDKLLKGADPATMPVERATNFELLVNRKTANALGIKIQPALLVRADKVLD
jgi:putative ABC transport system substrate-binding protein